MAAAPANELERTIMEIKVLFPNLKVTKDDLLNPKHEFLREFCEEALHMIDTKVSNIVSGDETTLLMKTVDFVNLGYSPELAIFLRIRDIVRQICPSDFTVIDFYKPQKQRTKFIIRVILNFCVYIEGQAQGARQILEKCTAKITRGTELKEKRKNLLESINEKARNKATHEENILMLQNELAVVNVEHQKALDAKNEKEKANVKASLELEKHKAVLNEKNELLQRLRETEKKLAAQVVTVKQLQSVEEMEEQLKEEKSKVSNDGHDYAATIQSKQKDCDYYVDVLEKISNLDFSCFDVLAELREHQSKLKDTEQKCASFATQLQTHEKEAVKIKTEISASEEKKQQLILQEEIIKQDIMKSTDDQKLKIEQEISALRELETERQKITEAIPELDELLNEQSVKRDLLLTTFGEQYKKALEKENRKVASFDKVLDSLCEKFRLF